jgi:hypothetical protein
LPKLQQQFGRESTSPLLPLDGGTRMVHELNAGRIAGAALMVAGITLISLLTHSNEAELEFQSGRAYRAVK